MNVSVLVYTKALYNIKVKLFNRHKGELLTKWNMLVSAT